MSKLEPSQDLVKEINDEHEAVVASFRGLLGHAIKCGEALRKAKVRVGYGNWLPWLGENCPDISERTASYYMWLARNKIEIEAAAAANQQSFADLSISGARKLLAEAEATEDNSAAEDTTAEQTEKEQEALAEALEEDGINSSPASEDLVAMLQNTAPDDLVIGLKDAGWEYEDLQTLAEGIGKLLTELGEEEEAPAQSPQLAA